MSRPLPLSALRAFEAAARTGSFRTAADDLSLTPSAVSHAVRGLEETLGTTLFLRTGRSIRLTDVGRTLMHHVERGFGELLLGIGSISAHKPQLLRVHSAPSFAAQWLLPRLRRLLQEVEGLELRIAAGTDYARFATDEFDLDIVYGMPSPASYGPSIHQNLIVLPLGTEVVTPLCAPALAAKIRAPRDLLRQTLIESEFQEGALAGVVRDQRAHRARFTRPPLRPQLPLPQCGRGRAGRGAGVDTPCGA